ncbi:MAG: lysophospholipase [Thermogutta sp.]
MIERDTVFTLSDGCCLRGRWWEPEGPCRARIFGLHGVLEHSGRYAKFAHDLLRAEVALEMIDIRGHGRSDGPRAFIESWQQILNDLDEIHQYLQNEGRQPDFLFGHSMGAALTILWATSRRPKIKGMILSAPPVLTAVRVPLVVTLLGRWLVNRWPGLRIVRLKTAEKYGRHAVSRDSQVLEELKNDPLVCRGPFPIKTGILLLELPKRLQEAAVRCDVPFLLLQGTGDKLSSYHGAELFFRTAPTRDKTLKLYDGLYHEVLSEPEREQVIADLLNWLSEHELA